MTSADIKCSQCLAPLPQPLWNRDDLTPCPSCETPVRASTFPALTRPAPPPDSGQIIVQEGEASCYFHPRKRAKISCSMCGRFLCALCDLDLHGNHVCPQCLQTGQTKGSLINLEKRRIVYDQAALNLALLPVLLFFIAPIGAITAPISIVMAIVSFRKPNSLVSRHHYRAWLALLIAGLQVILMIFMLVAMLQEPS